ncbi:hypothetical protein Ancab_020887 [Ancistrocladus abbreviatus]
MRTVASDELLEAGHKSPETMEDQHHLSRAESWRLMYPEVASEGNLVGIGSDNPSRSQQEDIIHDTTRGSDDLLRENPVLTNDEDAPPVATTGIESSSSLPSTSSESTSDEFNDDGDIAFSNSCSSEEADCASMDQDIESQASDITHKSLLKGAYPMDSPKTQVMERDEGYDTNRIPSSVFSRSDSLIPAEWSVASNESLFSIHIGNASFSREGPLTSSGEFGRSGELTKADELFLFSPSLPTLVETVVEENDTGSDGLGEKIVFGNVTQKDMGKTIDPDKVPPAAPAVRSSNVSYNSSCESEGSAYSFAFPILASGAQSNSVMTDSPRQQLSKSQQEVRNSGVMSKASSSEKKSSNRRFSCCSCFSCNSWFSCGSCRSCFSCGSCRSCFSCSSCWPRCC